MTHSPRSSGAGATAGSTTSGSSDSPSTTDVAKGEARNVGQTAAQAGGQVASTAADQAKEVVQETKNQAQDLVQQGRSQLREQAVSQQQKAAEGLQGVVSQLRGMANGESPAPGPVRDLLEQATDKVEQFADRLQNREPGDLLDDVRSFARRKPGTFLLGAALVGVVAGRLTSGVKAAHSDSGRLSGQYATGQYRSTPARHASTGYADQSTSYSGYTGTTTGHGETAGYSGTATTGTSPVPPPPYGTAVPPTTPAGWDDPTRQPGRGI
ncbi:hypothetical protein DQ238_09420 [Geodermatophilus sp. TF02-6]|uniref:hypothetical protein n=1 Tax=Geodermatophilus sp. TF02-6 TaxID=2250575 RepID=UPI000DEB8427|nr:hypothetical protein [Geodermatophilus sp. TF02-6]RBY79843.1 hypothetical protein DQ238_09420 [Geodermatophilus sp. TF02-6]